jgi:hypothetical protein
MGAISVTTYTRLSSPARITPLSPSASTTNYLLTVPFRILCLPCHHLTMLRWSNRRIMPHPLPHTRVCAGRHGVRAWDRCDAEARLRQQPRGGSGTFKFNYSLFLGGACTSVVSQPQDVGPGSLPMTLLGETGAAEKWYAIQHLQSTPARSLPIFVLRWVMLCNSMWSMRCERGLGCAAHDQ